jgi:GNAT superfamily N-acetyltransferase
VLARSWSVEIGGAEMVLDELYIRTRSQGIGSRAIEALAAWCRDRDVKRIFLETERPNHRARALYARHGFIEDDSIWMSREL